MCQEYPRVSSQSLERSLLFAWRRPARLNARAPFSSQPAWPQPRKITWVLYVEESFTEVSHGPGHSSRRCARGAAAVPAEWKELSCELRWLTCPGRTIRRWNCSAYVSECRAGQRAGALGNSSGVNSFTLRKMYSDIALTGSPLERDWPILGKKDRKQQQQWTLGQSVWVQLHLQSGGAVQVLFALGQKKKSGCFKG